MKPGEKWELSHMVRNRKQSIVGRLIQKDETMRGCWIVHTEKGIRTLYNVKPVKLVCLEREMEVCNV